MDGNFWMPLYVKDYLADTSRLSTVEHGAYLLLIMDYWINQDLPNDDKILSRISKLHITEWQEIKNTILSFFVIENNKLSHKRIDEELQRTKEIKTKNKERSAKAAQVRWEKQSLNNATRNAQSIPPSNTPSTPQAILDECHTHIHTHTHIQPHTQLPVIGESIDSPKKKKGSRLSEEFELPNDWITFCSTERPDLNPLEVFAMFKDYWIAQTGTKATKVDWFATWRNWVRNQKRQFNKQSRVVEINSNLAKLWRPSDD